MSIAYVQGASAIGAASIFAATPLSVAATFPSNNTAGNTLVVLALVASGGAGAGESGQTVTDSCGNTYTQWLWAGSGNNSGAAIGVWVATSIAAGANTVTFAYTGLAGFAGGHNYNHTVLVGEYAGLGTPVLQSSNYVQIYGASGTNPSTLAITDSLSTSVTATFKTAGPSGSNGIGTINTGAVLVDLLIGGINYLIAGCLAQTNALLNPPVTPSGYATFIQRLLVSDVPNGYYGYLWDPGAILTQRGNIDYDQVRTVARQGPGAKFQMFGGGTPVAGHVLVYDANGNAIDGGTGAGSSSPLTTKGDVYTRSASADTRLGVGTDGQVLTADSAQTAGLKWATNAGSGSQINVDGTPVGVAGISPITLQTNSATNATQNKLNLVAGSNVALTDSGTGNITIAASGGGGSGPGMAGTLSVAPPDPGTFSTSGSNPAGTTTNFVSGQFFSISLPISGGAGAKYYKSPLPGATPWNIYCAVSLTSDGTTGNDLAICLFDGSQGFVRRQRMTMVSTAWRWGWSSAVSDLATNATNNYALLAVPTYMRIRNDGTNVTASWSMDGGGTWFQLYSEAASNISSAVSYGFLLSNSSSSQRCGATFWTLYIA